MKTYTLKIYDEQDRFVNQLKIAIGATEAEFEAINDETSDPPFFFDTIHDIAVEDAPVTHQHTDLLDGLCWELMHDRNAL